MVQNQGELHTLIELVIRHHMALQSVSPTLAEVYYILEAQKLDGYGVDFFQAKVVCSPNVLVNVFPYLLTKQPLLFNIIIAAAQVVGCIPSRDIRNVLPFETRQLLQNRSLCINDLF